MPPPVAPARRHIRRQRWPYYSRSPKPRGPRPCNRCFAGRGCPAGCWSIPEQRIPLAAALRLLEESAEVQRTRRLRPADGRGPAAVDLGALGLVRAAPRPACAPSLQTLIPQPAQLSGRYPDRAGPGRKPASHGHSPEAHGRAPRPRSPPRRPSSCWASCSASAPPCPASAGTLKGVNFPPCRPGRHPSAPATLQLPIEIRQRVQRHRLRDGRPRQPEPAGRPGACRLRAAPGRRARRVQGGHARANRAQGPVACGFRSAGRRSSRRHWGLGLQVRTLQRQLSADGAAFSELVSGVGATWCALSGPAGPQPDARGGAGRRYGQLSSLHPLGSIGQFRETPSEWRRRTRPSRARLRRGDGAPGFPSRPG